ncbi:hypothetical protein EDC05_002222 [Coemansia umbellata]|nr:hypothetical protein EDC05_002222 [Coemansia umbellata]
MPVLGGANHHALLPPGPILNALLSLPEGVSVPSATTVSSMTASVSTPPGAGLAPAWPQPIANFGPAALPLAVISESRPGVSGESSSAAEASLDNDHDTTYSKSSTDAELQNTSAAESSSGTDHESDKSARKRTRYQCEQCLKCFTRPSSLTTHIYTHTGEKPHKCSFPGCSKRFSVLSNLRRHMKLHQDPNPHPRRRSHRYTGGQFMPHPYGQHVFPVPSSIELCQHFGPHPIPGFAYQVAGEPIFGPPGFVPLLSSHSVLPPPQHQQQQQFQQQQFANEMAFASSINTQPAVLQQQILQPNVAGAPAVAVAPASPSSASERQNVLALQQPLGLAPPYAWNNILFRRFSTPVVSSRIPEP